MVYVGCGSDRRRGYVNVDLRADVADVVASGDHLPFRGGSVDEVLALDILEHFRADDTQRVLGEWRRVLADGGRLVVKVPNLLQLAKWIVAGHRVPGAIRNIMGGHRWGPDGSWDCHHHNFTPETLEAEFAQADLAIISNDEALNMTAVAVSV